MKKVLGLIVLVILVAIIAGREKPVTEPKPTTAEPKPTTADEGDTVAIRYPATTILCTDRGDASKIYLAGELALRETLRLENSASKAVQSKYDARKAMMREAYSCT